MRGVSLIESVVTLGVVILLITGLVVGTTSSLQNAQASKARSLGVQYAQEALEVLRQERDSNWTTFASQATIGTPVDNCMDGNKQLTAKPQDGCTPFTGTFSRTITFTKVDDHQMDVAVLIFWLEGSTGKNITLHTTYTDWK
jgi:type II secretory pathway pseudopilin PulG